MSFGWGIISAGRHPDQKMAPAINSTNSKIVAIASRDIDRARAFSEKHNVLNLSF